jgi:potassium channel subfamily K
MSITKVGYGDMAFKTLQGLLFPSVWLLFSTLMAARVFLYLPEARIDKRHKRIASEYTQLSICLYTNLRNKLANKH